MRYLPPQYYIQFGDFKGGLRYFNWFEKNFPDDVGFPHFLFEWAIVLFKTGKLKEAQTKLFQTYKENTYIFDKFLGKPIVPIEKWEGSNLKKPEFATEYFSYFRKQEGLESFRRLVGNYHPHGAVPRFVHPFYRDFSTSQYRERL